MAYKRDKAHRIEGNTIDLRKKAEYRLKVTLKGYIDRKIRSTQISIDFVAENLNHGIAEIRKRFKDHNITIRKTTSGTRQGRRHAIYYIAIQR